MTSQHDALVDVVRRNVDAVQNNGDFTVFDEIFAEDFVDHTPQRGVPAGRRRGVLPAAARVEC
jgi:ketosteroid isomerase-like protein